MALTNRGAVTPPGGPNPRGPTSALAIVLAIGAAFLWANELYALTIAEFRGIAVQNYGFFPLRWLEIGYQVFLHAAVFCLARVTFEMTLTFFVGFGAYRLFGF